MLAEKLPKERWKIAPLFCIISIFVLGTHFASSLRNHHISSSYFDPRLRYERKYSNIRQKQAESFIHDLSTTPFLRDPSTNPLICLGMLTITRPKGMIYCPTSLASMLTGLSQEERNSLYVMPFIAHTTPSEHPSWQESWLRNAADQVLLYNESMPEYQHIKDLEDERKKTGVPDREKHLFDYGYLTRACLMVNASYVMMLEDDVLAADGWLLRAINALKDIEWQTAHRGLPEFFYLRLFNSEGPVQEPVKRIYQHDASLVIISFAAIAAVLFARRHFTSRNHRMTLYIIPSILLFVYVLLVVRTRPGDSKARAPFVKEMLKGEGCCFQAIIYPPNRVQQLADHYSSQRIGFVDSLAEEYASEHNDTIGKRWAVVPSMVQHIGGQSSKGDNWGTDKPGEMTEAQRIFNFEFELHNPNDLRREHEEYLSHLPTTIDPEIRQHNSVGH